MRIPHFFRNKKVVRASIIGIISFIALSAVAFVMTHPVTSTDASDSSPVTAEVSDSGDMDTVELTSDQSEAIAAYTDDMIQVQALLKANSWLDTSQNNVMHATDTTVSESSVATQSEITSTYAITALKKDSSKESDTAGNPITMITYTLSVLTGDNSSHIVSLVEAIPDRAVSPSNITITSDLFKSAPTFMRAKASESLAVSGLTPSVEDCIDRQTDALKEALTSYCSIYYPTASEATWLGDITILQSDSTTVKLSFSLNNKNQTTVGATYDKTSHQVSISNNVAKPSRGGGK